MLLAAGCANPVSSAWADFETNRAIEAAAADDSFPSAAEAGVSAAVTAPVVAKSKDE